MDGGRSGSALSRCLAPFLKLKENSTVENLRHTPEDHQNLCRPIDSSLIPSLNGAARTCSYKSCLSSITFVKHKQENNFHLVL